MTPLDLLKLTGGPGSIQLLLVLAAVGLWLHYRRPQYRAGRLILGITAFVYWMLATPAIALTIERWLPRSTEAPILDTRFDTVVVLDGDNRRGRLAKALAVWQETSPRRIVVSGQDWLRDELITAGVPEERVSKEGMTANTREQIAWLGKMTSSPSSGQVAVIASRLQVPRVAALIRRANIHTTLVAAPIDVEPWSTGAWMLVPSYSALRLSRDALYECVALKYYEFRGWIDPLGESGGERRAMDNGGRPQGMRPLRV